MNIVYVDDVESEIRDFKRPFLLLNSGVNVIGVTPEFSIEDTYDAIIQHGEIDAVISDFALSDSCDVSFTGTELIGFLSERHPLLSCFVLTAFENNAVKSDAVDVYKVYPKSSLRHENNTNTENAVSFCDLVIEQIKKDKKKLFELQKEHAELTAQRSNDDWTSEKEERLIFCDNMLEHHYGGEKISGFFKTRDYSDKLVTLIDATKELLKEVKGHGTSS